MKLKKYKDFKYFKENSSIDDIDNFINKLDYIRDGYYMDSLADGNIRLIRYDLWDIENWQIVMDELSNDIKNEIELYDFNSQVIEAKSEREVLIVIISNKFVQENNFELFTNDDFVSTDITKIFRFRKEINEKFFSCIYGDLINHYEIMTSDSDPFYAYDINYANAYYIDWQYELKLKGQRLKTNL